MSVREGAGDVLTAACLHPTALRGGASRAQDPAPHRPGGDGGVRGAHDHRPDAAGERWDLGGLGGPCGLPLAALRGQEGWLETRKDRPP